MALTVRPVTVSPSLLLALHAQQPARYPALFESAAASRLLGRFDILFAFPDRHLTLHANQRLSMDDGKALPVLSSRHWMNGGCGNERHLAKPFSLSGAAGWSISVTNWWVRSNRDCGCQCPYRDQSLRLFVFPWRCCTSVTRGRAGSSRNRGTKRRLTPSSEISNAVRRCR